MHADDLILISASIINLQRMLDICSNVGLTLGIKFNSSKSSCLHIGPSKINAMPVMLVDNLVINWCNKIKYLGVWIKSNIRFDIDVDERRRKFFMSVNCILTKTKFMCDMVKLRILESHCLSLLLYCSDSGIFDVNLLNMLNCCWNTVIRKIFGYHRWESVRSVLSCLNKLNVYYLINLRRTLFIKNTFENCHIGTTLRSFLSKYIYSNEFQTLLHNFNIDFSLSFSEIKNRFQMEFNASC